jgi:hypothetical protein
LLQLLVFTPEAHQFFIPWMPLSRKRLRTISNELVDSFAQRLHVDAHIARDLRP